MTSQKVLQDLFCIDWLDTGDRYDRMLFDTLNQETRFFMKILMFLL